MADWPNDDDGAVLRSLAEDGFDFDADYDVEYMVDFPNWPPSKEAMTALEVFGTAEAFDPSDEGDGYVLVTINQKVSYENVTATQRNLTTATSRFGGNCETWGVMNCSGIGV